MGCFRGALFQSAKVAPAAGLQQRGAGNGFGKFCLFLGAKIACLLQPNMRMAYSYFHLFLFHILKILWKYFTLESRIPYSGTPVAPENPILGPQLRQKTLFWDPSCARKPASQPNTTMTDYVRQRFTYFLPTFTAFCHPPLLLAFGNSGGSQKKTLAGILKYRPCLR